MSMLTVPRFAALVAPLCTLLLTGSAHAHISLEQGGTHKSRYGDGEIKDGPCGRAGGARSANVYTYAPGETITITLAESIAHPSYFRIAFDADGDDDFLEPASIDPIDPGRACPFNANDHCGASDFYNNDAVLMDNLDPHLAGGPQTYTWQVTLPDVQCDNCTLQIIQVMEDTIHGAYAPKGSENEGFYIEDIYHQCIDLVLTGDSVAGSGGSGGTPATGGSTADGGGDASDGGGGCGCRMARGRSGAGSAGWAAILLLGLLWRRARGRRVHHGRRQPVVASVRWPGSRA